jgi:hypothetical protein
VIFAAVARWRRQFLLAVLAVAVALSLGAQVRNGWPAFVVLTALSIGLCLASAVATLGYRPAALTALPAGPAPAGSGPAGSGLADPPGAGLTLLTAGQTFLGVGVIGEQIGDAVRGADDRWTGLVLGLFWVVLLGLFWHLAWGWYGVRLTPDGLVDRQPFGTLRVPWDAFATDRPVGGVRRNQLTLRYRQPELVRSRGLRPFGRTTVPATAEPVILARAIHDYVTANSGGPRPGA